MKKILFFTFFLSIAFFAVAQKKYPIVVIETNHGTMKAILYDDTPRHSTHFLKLVKQGYFNGTLFYRVIRNFMIQGGAQDSRNAPAGIQVGSGRRDMEILPEFRTNRFHKKGALAVPRRDEKENPQKKSDASQFYIVHGQKYTNGQLDTLEMRVNVPIKNKIISQYYIPYKEKLAELKNSDPHAFNTLLDSILNIVDSLYEIAPGKLHFDLKKREVYSTLGGAHYLDGDYTVFGEVIEGLEVIDKIASLAVDGNMRPKKDAKIIRVYVE